MMHAHSRPVTQENADQSVLFHGGEPRAGRRRRVPALALTGALVLGGLMTVCPGAWAAGPSYAGNLVIEWRQIAHQDPDASGDRPGVVTYSSRVDPARASPWGWRVHTDAGAPLTGGRLIVLNGATASLHAGVTVPVQWWDAVVWPARDPAASPRVGAASTTRWIDAGQDWQVRARWSGRRGAPVRLELQARAVRVQDPNLTVGTQAPGAVDAHEQVSTTVDMPLGVWTTVASTAHAAEAPPPGVLRSDQGQSPDGVDVQFRVSLP
jgi:hypothetical protein